MDVLSPLERLVESAAFLLTLGFMAATFVWAALRFGRLPREVLQLRLFENQELLIRGLAMFFLAAFDGFLVNLPEILGLGESSAWILVTSAIWVAGTWAALLLLVRAFHSATGSGRSAVAEAPE